MTYDDRCPAADAIQSAEPLRPRLLHQGIYHLRQHGVKWCFQALGRLLLKPRPRNASPAAKPAEFAPLGLQPADLVRVKSEDQIRMTLDARGRHKGLLVTPEMYRYCGLTFRVHGRVERMYLEESQQVRRIANTVLLRDVFCSGRDVGCDRSCFLFWREAWLDRVAETPEARGASATVYQIGGGQ
jgi:hypothetical protein